MIIKIKPCQKDKIYQQIFLIDITKLDLELTNKTKFKIAEAEDNKDDFSPINIKTINVF